MPTSAVSEVRDVFLECPRGEFVIPPVRPTERRLSVIVPTFQEAGNIQPFLSEVCGVLDRRIPNRYELIVVDDDSPDRTWSLAAKISIGLPAVRVIRRTGERGLASAVFRGYQAAEGSVLGTINADFQHPPRVLASLLDLTREADVAVASRYCGGGSTSDWASERLLISRAALRAGKLMLPRVFSGLTDPLSGCYLFRREVIEDVTVAPMGFKSLIEVLARGRVARVGECGYEMRSRLSGRSKATLETSLCYLKQLRLLQTGHAA